ncbi:MAG: nrdA [Chlamydiales bacterium]|jgi:ribonucleoside-diphosphate reductase alpha chain|nr:nrdA [Chlamydiales bacterium]
MALTVQDIRVYVETPKSLKPQLPWAELLLNLIIPSGLPKVKTSDGVVACQPEKLLRAVGAAITDERLAQGATQASHIFTAQNKFVVVSTVNRVLLKLSSQGKDVIDSEEVHEIVEDSLGEEGEPLAAKGYLLYRTQKQRRHRASERLAVIRRNGKKVDWNSEKIYAAVNKGFLADYIHSGQEPSEATLQEIGEKAKQVTQQVIHEVMGLNREVIHIEEIQDEIEKSLWKMGYQDAARKYIAYRAERARLRKLRQEEEERAFLPGMVTPDLLARVDFASIDLDLPLSRQELTKRLSYSTSATLSPVDTVNTILLNARQLIELDPEFRFFAGRILLTYIYEEVLPWKISDGIGQLKKAHEEAFVHYLNRGIELEILSPELKNFNLAAISKQLNPMADLQFDFLGIHTLYDRYLIHERQPEESLDTVILNKQGKKRIETPQFMWMRVAMGLAYNEKEKEDAVLNFYGLYTSKRFCSSTPTLFNSGTKRPQLSSCYGLTSGDEISDIKTDKEGNSYPVGIFGTFTNCAQLSKYSGGLGVDFTSVRGMGSHIKGTNGESLGIIPFLKIMNDTAIAVNQGGKRRGVVCTYLESWHNDIEEFLELRKNTGDDRRRTHDMHTANWIPDLFIKRAIRGEQWTLFRTNEVPGLHESFGKKFEDLYHHYEKMAEEGKIYGRKVRAAQLWKKMLNALFETGHPWITFKDPCNIRSPQDHVGVIHNSNLCTEITLNNSDDEHFVCNLGSLNLATFVKEDGKIDFDDLARTIQVAVRMLDNVVDINFYPTIPAKNANMRHRPVGLGLMGWQDVLHKKRIPFESDAMVTLADELMEFIAWNAYSASCQLAKERGAYPTFKGSKWDRGMMPLDTLQLLDQERGSPVDVNRSSKMPWDELRQQIARFGMRNSNVLAIAPTATISNIFGCSACIEPVYRHIYTKSNLSGEFTWITPALVEALKKRKLWGKEMLEDLKYYKGELDSIDYLPEDLKREFKTAFKMDQIWLIKGSAVRQKWIDQAQSINLFLDKPDEKKISLLYLKAWMMGLKTTYYLKNKSASDIEDASLDIKRKAREMGVIAEEAREASEEIKACRIDDPECEACQ